MSELQGIALVQKAQALIAKLQHNAQDAKDASEAHEREALDLAQHEWRAAHWQLGDLAPALVVEIECLRAALEAAKDYLTEYVSIDYDMGDAGFHTNPWERVKPVMDQIDAALGIKTEDTAP